MTGDRPLGLVVRIVAVGVATGVTSQLAQDLLPEGWLQVGNAISPWLLVAFLLGSTMPDRRWAAAAGVVALAIATATFYTVTTIRFGAGGGMNAAIIWGTGALLGGSVFGVAGHGWRHGTDLARAVGIGLVGAAAICEGVYLRLILPDPWTGTAFIVAGLLVPLILGRTLPERLRGYAAIVPALVLGAIGYVAFIGFYDWVSLG